MDEGELPVLIRRAWPGATGAPRTEGLRPKKTGSDPRQVPTPPGALGQAPRLYDGIAPGGMA
ncbi:hypothetical protein BN1263500172 [Stenotrophomonas indicatrix]|nr:hypothetical protein BN1263500172 [Stenotrophomonas indicatrix]